MRAGRRVRPPSSPSRREVQLASIEQIVVVGASVAGGRAVEALRQEGFEGRVVLVGEEPERPYERPPLSKDVLRGATPDEKVFLRPADYYAENRIELRRGVAATRLVPDERAVHLSTGESLGYDRLLIATGATVR